MSADSLKEMLTVHCLKCGFSWQKRTDRPVKCPSCQSRDWDKPPESTAGDTDKSKRLEGR